MLFTKFSQLLEVVRCNKKIIEAIRCGPAQDDPFDLIIWYTAKQFLLLGIVPIRDVELTCIF